MILHLVTDEKFTDYAIQQFSAPEMASEFVLVPCNYGPGDVVHSSDNVRVVERYTAEFNKLLNSLGQYTAVIFHGMHWGGWQTPVLKAVPNHVKVAWVFWGGEIYGRNDVCDTFKAPLSKLLNSIHLHGKVVNHSWQIPKELFKRIDYILTDEEEEYKFAEEFIESKVKFLQYNYYSLNETLGHCYDEHVVGENIFLGNSATVENNFFEIMLRLRFLRLNGRKIIVPLSYGAPWVRNAVLKFGKWILGKSFNPLVEFMPRDDYNKMMLSCCAMVMNHWNPQAQGNMITGLWLGMRLFLSERSMSYAYFKRIGLKVFSVERDLKWYRSNVFAPMSQEDVRYNRNILMKYYGEAQMLENVKIIVKELNSPKK